ncbi:MAG TPA: folylpolyglutamate synthase/dihydrofolate synthase family protein [Xanthobacteraceae bacterium]|jgi:dihydrofolate synthase/folylpolyglutamate synthase
MSIDSVVARLTALHPKRIDLSLDRMWRLLDALDHPERSLPPVVHVAGTNGKGSAIAFMRAVLEAAGLRVHVYTSPHLVRFNERFRLGGPDQGTLVSDHELTQALEQCERANADAPITVFEITTAAALVLFAHNPADVLLLEVGLGGRLDATNVVERPVATVITPVSLDHSEYLGDSISRIATEKAGILKHGVPAIVAAQARDALAAIERTAARLKAPLRIAGEDWTATEERGRLVYQDENGLLDLPAPKLFGRHQFENAGVAIATLRAIRELHIPAAAFERGIMKADWPARMQLLSQGKLAALVPSGGELWLDGGHNPHGAYAIANALADLEERISRPLILVIGMLATKDSLGFLKAFTGLARHVVAVPIRDQEKGLPADAIREAARSLGIPAQSSGDLASALTAIRGFASSPAPRILITGSLYLAGEALSANGTLPM